MGASGHTSSGEKEEALWRAKRAELIRARQLAKAMDYQIGLRGLPFGIGLDAVIGLVPLVGDVLGAAVGVYHLKLAQELGLPVRKQFYMVMNLLADMVLGFMPVLGDLVDLFYQAHRRNWRILLEHLPPEAQDELDGRR